MQMRTNKRCKHGACLSTTLRSARRHAVCRRDHHFGHSGETSFPRSSLRDSPASPLERDGERAQNCLPPSCRDHARATAPAILGERLVCPNLSLPRLRRRGNYSLTFGTNRSSTGECGACSCIEMHYRPNLM